MGYRRSSEGTGSETLCTVNNEVSKILLNLDPQTDYVVRLRAINSVDDSDFSDEVTFTTFGGFCVYSTLQQQHIRLIIFHCFTGAIVITASPEGTITTGQGQIVSLQCMLEGATSGDNIQYQWRKDGASVPSGVQTNGGRS